MGSLKGQEQGEKNNDDFTKCQYFIELTKWSVIATLLLFKLGAHLRTDEIRVHCKTHSISFTWAGETSESFPSPVRICGV